MATLAALQHAIVGDDFGGWLESAAAGMSDDAAALLARVVAHDRTFFAAYPDAVGSWLIARTLAVSELDSLRGRWLAEVKASGKPWFRAVTPFPLSPGRIATFHSTPALRLVGLARVSFLDEDTLVLEPNPHLTKRTDRLRWRWRGSEARLEEGRADAEVTDYPRFESDGWGPVYVRRAEGEDRVELPMPEEADAEAQRGVVPGTVLVYGSYDEYAGGFVWVVDLASLRVRKRLETHRPVYGVAESADGSVVLANMRHGVVYWRDGESTELAIEAQAIALSPSGLHLGVGTDTALEVWTLASAPSDRSSQGFDARFSPDGRRLVRGKVLYDAVTGERVADLDVSLGSYLEGGPAWPWFHLGNHKLVNLFSVMKVWNARTGARVDVGGHLRFPHWYSVAYDDSGERVAALKEGTGDVVIRRIPDTTVETTISFELDRLERVALSPRGGAVAVARGAQLEVRTSGGGLVFAGNHPGPNSQEDARIRYRDDSLRFVSETKLASYVPRDGWRIFDLSTGTSEPVPPPHVPNASVKALKAPWSAERSGVTIFRHAPSGTELAVPLAGDWVMHPSDPAVLACNDGVIDLVEPA